MEIRTLDIICIALGVPTASILVAVWIRYLKKKVLIIRLDMAFYLFMAFVLAFIFSTLIQAACFYREVL